MIHRRMVLMGIAGALAAPAIIRADGLMPVRLVEQFVGPCVGSTEPRVAILGWEALDADGRTPGIILLHLPASWRSPYL